MAHTTRWPRRVTTSRHETRPDRANAVLHATTRSRGTCSRRAELPHQDAAEPPLEVHAAAPHAGRRAARPCGSPVPPHASSSRADHRAA